MAMIFVDGLLPFDERFFKKFLVPAVDFVSLSFAESCWRRARVQFLSVGTKDEVA